ncbi:hypothetical protein FIBSPDRAFT_30915 [Athelia psychrophila]|uniref:Peptidase C19 ubiquitin carboxyl-terminal hydrolase domain-containing protein n=1 Tax=Athelia psychrophila TaxID=1759441 RepID=A0A166G3K4_9AGAM|nr:hypothetical protein FIBSPDRAFT_30915 [Fibularhizoctonia sp. CBS 109695]
MMTTHMIEAATSPITRMFSGEFRSTLPVSQQKDSSVIEGWRVLQLDIQREQIHTVKDALRRIYECAVFGANGLAHAAGRHSIDASQQVLIVPLILVLDMLRFLCNAKFNSVVKIGKQATFELDLEISPEIMAGARRSAGAARYKLFGVLYHHGLSASGRNYTLGVLHPNRDPSSSTLTYPPIKHKICTPVVSLCHTKHTLGPHVPGRPVVDPYPPHNFTLRRI